MCLPSIFITRHERDIKKSRSCLFWSAIFAGVSCSLSATTSSGWNAAMDYKPVVVQRHARPAQTKHSAESRYWRQFKYPVFIKEYAPVTSVHFAPTKPHRYVVTAATRVQIYAPRTQKVTKTISRFKDVARSGHIRGDGKLVVAGDDTGLIQVSLYLICACDEVF